MGGRPRLQRRLTETYEERFGRTPTLHVVEKNLEVTTRRVDGRGT